MKRNGEKMTEKTGFDVSCGNTLLHVNEMKLDVEFSTSMSIYHYCEGMIRWEYSDGKWTIQNIFLIPEELTADMDDTRKQILEEKSKYEIKDTDTISIDEIKRFSAEIIKTTYNRLFNS